MPELLGTASFPSGDLLLIDFGLLRMWCGDGPFEFDEGSVPPDMVTWANETADYEIAGQDALAAGIATKLASVKGRYAFDLRDSASVAEKVAEVCRRDGLDASVREMARVSHYRRVGLLLDDLPDGAEVPFFGGWAVAVRGLPTDRPVRVLGERMDQDGPDAQRWHSVWVEVADGEPVRSVACGYVPVDEARLMFADPAALNAWRTDELIDGLADLAFWGADAERVAERTGAGTLDQEGTFGWTDLTDEEWSSRAHELVALRDADGLKFRIDGRPHDDHYRILQQIYRSATESGSAEVGGALMTGWFTTWGDAAFPVYRDLAGDGTLLRVRVELGAPEIVRLRRRLERLWFGDLAKAAIVSARVAGEGVPVTWLYREEPDNEQDSGWRVFAGDESEEYLEDPANCVLVPLRELIREEPALEALFEQSAPVAFERETPEDDFVAVAASEET